MVVPVVSYTISGPQHS